MTKFIEVTTPKGVRVTLNINHIVGFQTEGTGTRILLDSGIQGGQANEFVLLVSETYMTVKNRISN